MLSHYRKMLVILLLLVITGQPLAAMLSACMMSQDESSTITGVESIDNGAALPSAAPHNHGMHEQRMHTDHMPATASNTPTHALVHSVGSAPYLATTDAHQADHDCCSGLCSCIAMGCYSHAAAATAGLFDPSAAAHHLSHRLAEQSTTPFLTLSLRPPIRLA